MGSFKFTFITVLSLLCLSSTIFAAPLSLRKCNFIFDLDDTLIRHLHPGETATEGSFTAYSRSHGLNIYHVNAGAPEMLQSLAEDYPNCKISIASGGERERNIEALKKIKLPNGESAYDLIDGRILSKNDLTHSKSGTLFDARTNQMRKDLGKLVTPEEMPNTLMVEDNPQWLISGQEKNVTFVGEQPTKRQNFYGDGPQTKEQWIQEENKLARTRGIIDRSMQIADSTQVDLRDASWNLQFTMVNGKPVYQEKLLSNLDLLRDGARRFHIVNSGYHLTTVTTVYPTEGCNRALLGYALGP